MHEIPTTTDVLIIGGGPAGAAAAAILLDGGADVCVVEKQVFPRFVIGESLLPRCMDLLEQAELLDVVRDRGYLRKDGATFLRGGERCTYHFSEQHADGWDHTYQVPRGDFDQTLLNAVRRKGATIFEGHEVTDVTVGPEPSAVVKTPAGESAEIRARFVVDASGYGRVLPRLLGLDRPSHLARRHSLFTWVASDRREEGPAAGRTWVAVHPGGAWIWAIPFADGKTSVGVVAEPEFFESYPADPTTRMRDILAGEPNVCERLGDSPFIFEPHLIDGYSVGVERLHGPGYCLVGNTMEFLDPVFSSGVTLALESGVAAAKLIARQLAGEDIDWAVEYDAVIEQGVDVFRAYVDAWYDGALPTLMFAHGDHTAVQRQITGVLAGYVFDESNPFVVDPRRRLRVLARAVNEGSPAPSA